MTGVGAGLVFLSAFSAMIMLSTIWRNGRLAIFKWSAIIFVVSLIFGLAILVR